MLDDSYKKYLGEIIIDGYTDTDGDYSYNLELSQKRSLAVAQYLLDIKSDFLKDSQVQELKDWSDSEWTFHVRSGSGCRRKCR